MPKKIGLLTLPLRDNYGGILQAIALYNYLKKLGHQVVLLQRVEPIPLRRKALIGALSRCSPLMRIGVWLQKKINPMGRLGKILQSNLAAATLEREVTVHKRLWNRLIETKTRTVHDEKGLKKEIERLGLDTIVVGSDQVWRLDYAPGGNPLDFMLEFASDSRIRKISYAASFGHADWRTDHLTGRAKTCLDRFHAVSVRESSGARICKEVFQREDVSHVLDPTMLMGPEFFENILTEAIQKKKNATLVTYVLDTTESSLAIIDATADVLGDGYSRIQLGLASKNNGSTSTESTVVSISQWIFEFKSADFIVTDSFHGMIFSILFKKSFLVILNKERGVDRFLSILEQLDLLDRVVDPNNKSEIKTIASLPIDYERVNFILSRLQLQSREFLMRALN